MYKQVSLKNGLRLITSQMPGMESVAIGLWIGVGARYEDKTSSGISHLMEHMLFKGTVTRTANMLKEAVEGVGGSFNGFTAEEVTCYLVKLPSAHTELGLDILSDMVLNPELDPVELEKEKRVICEEIKMYIDHPAQHVYDVLAGAMWPKHALGRPILGYANTVKRFSRDDLVNFKDEFYQPANMSIIMSGKLNRSRSVSFVKKLFPMPSKKKRFLCKRVKQAHKEARLKMLYKKTKQTHIALGFHSLPKGHKLRYALMLLHIILGGNMSSRLFEKLREKKALCYDISSSVKEYKETGAFIIHAGVDSDKFLEATNEITNELSDIKKNFVSPDELNRAKEYSRGQFLLALEDTASRMLWLGDRIMSEGKAPSVEDVFREIGKVTKDDIKKVANIVFNRDNLSLAAIGPVSDKIRKEINKILR